MDKKNLIKFSSSELVISRDEAIEILKYFFGNFKLNSGDLTDDDIAFAQALLVEAIDLSNGMMIAEAVFRSKANFSGTIKRLATTVAKQSTRLWWKNEQKKANQEIVIYDSIRNTIAMNFKSIWTMRVQGA
ncbi:MAG: hypothetical protein V4608_00555 [Bacteroidota bacterium]